MANEQLKTLEDKLSYTYDTKIAIHDAIVAKGIDIPEGTVFRDYAAKIGEIKTGTSFDSSTTLTVNTVSGYDLAVSYYDKNVTSEPIFLVRSIRPDDINYLDYVPIGGFVSLPLPPDMFVGYADYTGLEYLENESAELTTTILKVTSDNPSLEIMI